MGLIHQYRNNGYNIVLDINSGCIHVVDEVVYETVALLDQGKDKEEILESLRGKFPEGDIQTALEECEELIEGGMLFTEDIYKEAIQNFTRHETVVKALCLHIAHDCKIGNNCIITNACQLAGEVVVDDFAILGGMTAVHQFVHIGKHVMIQGGSLIGKDVPPYVKAGRLPLSYVGVNSIGLRRREFSNEKINEIQDIYRILYQSGLNNSDAIERIEAEMPASRERDEIIMFVRNSKRGIMKGYMG